jgi:hypothetical protein
VILGLVVFTALALVPLWSFSFTRTSEAARQELEPPAEILSVAELSADLQQSGGQAERYLGKVLRVSGSAAKIGKSLAGAPLIDIEQAVGRKPRHHRRAAVVRGRRRSFHPSAGPALGRHSDASA